VSAESELLFEAVKNYFIWIVLALMAVAFTWHVVSWSEQHGKLAMPPDYDDSHSLVEGAVRLGVFQEGGLGALVKDYQERMPHSFLHYYWTGFLFWLFGVNQSTPYAASGLLLFGVLWVFARLLPIDMPLIQKACFIFAFLGIPVCFHLIHDYRSEVTMAGLLFIASAEVVLWSWNQNRKWFGLALPGIFFSLAFLMKPMMFPYPFGMLALSTLVAIFSNVVRQDRLSWGRFSLGIVLLWVMALCLISIHLWIFWDRIIAYISDVAFTSDFYKIKDKGSVWYFHWLGYSGLWHLSAMKTIFVLTIATTAMTALVPLTRKISPGFKWYSMVFLTTGAFGGIAINQVNQPFFGMTFQLLVTATALLAFAHFFSNPKIYWVGPVVIFVFALYWLPVVSTRQFLIPATVVVAFLLVYCFAIKVSAFQMINILCSGVLAVFCWKVTQVAPFHNYLQTTQELCGNEGVTWRRLGPQKMYEILKLVKKSGSLPVVWFSNYSWVDANTVGWESAKMGMPWKMYNSVDLQLGSAPITDIAEILVLSEPGVLGELETPHFDAAKGIAEIVKVDSRFRFVGSISDPNGKQMAVFSRLPLLEK
jgi:hypothetical protein